MCPSRDRQPGSTLTGEKDKLYPRPRGGEQWELRTCRCCPSGIASGTTPTAAHTAVLRYAPKSQQSNPPDCVPLVEVCGSSSLSEERRSQKRDASLPEVFTRSASISRSRISASTTRCRWESVVVFSLDKASLN
jgi:hypothetical protein